LLRSFSCLLSSFIELGAGACKHLHYPSGLLSAYSVVIQGTLAALPRWFVWSICTVATSRLLLSLKGIQNAKEWDSANKIVRRDIEMEPRDGVKFIYAEHEDDECPNRRSINGHLKTTTLGKYDDD
jgi:hypothetical protein